MRLVEGCGQDDKEEEANEERKVFPEHATARYLLRDEVDG